MQLVVALPLNSFQGNCYPSGMLANSVCCCTEVYSGQPLSLVPVLRCANKSVAACRGDIPDDSGEWSTETIDSSPRKTLNET